MEVVNGYILPPELLTGVFHYLPIHCLLQTIPSVCRSWNDLLQQMSFWWDRLNYEGIHINRDHKLDLINNIDQKRVVKLLRKTCHHYTGPHTEQNMRYHEWRPRWLLHDGNFFIVSYFLMFKTPEEVEFHISIDRNFRNKPDLDLILLQLSHTNCKIRFGYNLPIDHTLAIDDLLTFSTRENTKCKMKRFYGCVKSISSLPKSLEYLSIYIPCKEDGVALDPGIAGLPQTLPALIELQVHVRAGMDVSHFPHVPSIMAHRYPGEQLVRSGVSIHLYDMCDTLCMTQLAWASEVERVLQLKETPFHKIYRTTKEQFNKRFYDINDKSLAWIKTLQ